MKNDPHVALFARLLGHDYENLSQPLRKLHGVAGGTKFRGTASVLRGHGLAWLLGHFVSLPAARDSAPLSVVIEKTETTEVWHRDFAGDVMVSTLSERDGTLSERLGPVRFGFELHVQDGAIIWTLRSVAVLGIPLPSGWFDGVSAREYAVHDSYHFEVQASLPLIGRLVDYRGELQVDADG